MTATSRQIWLVEASRNIEATIDSANQSTISPNAGGVDSDEFSAVDAISVGATFARLPAFRKTSPAQTAHRRATRAKAHDQAIV